MHFSMTVWVGPAKVNITTNTAHSRSTFEKEEDINLSKWWRCCCMWSVLREWAGSNDFLISTDVWDHGMFPAYKGEWLWAKPHALHTPILIFATLSIKLNNKYDSSQSSSSHSSRCPWQTSFNTCFEAPHGVTSRLCHSEARLSHFRFGDSFVYIFRLRHRTDIVTELWQVFLRYSSFKSIISNMFLVWLMLKRDAVITDTADSH